MLKIRESVPILLYVYHPERKGVALAEEGFVVEQSFTRNLVVFQ